MGYFTSSLGVNNVLRDSTKTFNVANAVLGTSNKNIVGGAEFSAFHQSQSEATGIRSKAATIFNAGLQQRAAELTSAIARLDSIGGILSVMGDLAAQASDSTLTAAQRTELNDAFNVLGTLAGVLTTVATGITLTGSSGAVTSYATTTTINVYLEESGSNIYTFQQVAVDATTNGVGTFGAITTTVLAGTAITAVTGAFTTLGLAIQNLSAALSTINASVDANAVRAAALGDRSVAYKAPDAFLEAGLLNKALTDAANTPTILRQYLTFEGLKGSLVSTLLR